MSNIRKIIGVTVGTPMNPNKVKPTPDEIKNAVDEYLAENPVVGTPGENGINAEMYAHKVYKVYSVADIEARCNEINTGRFYVINCGEVFNYVSGSTTTINTGDICVINSSSGSISGLMVVDNQPIDIEEGTLIQWYEIDENGDYTERYTAMLNFGCTEADKAEIVQSVLSALPTWQGGSY